MSIVSISDLHISKSGDQADQVLKYFLKHDKTKSAEIVCFLGDIFNAVVGNKKEYIQKYPTLFNGIAELLKEKKNVYFIEGNHDFHLESVFLNFFKQNNIPSERFIYLRRPIVIEHHKVPIKIGHGDDIELDNPGYEKWKNIYTSKWFKFIMDYIFPFWLINYLGDRASKNSKSRSARVFNYEKTKNTFREDLKSYDNEEAMIVLMGHSHIEDLHKVESKHGKFMYINNGFPVNHKNFVYIEGDKASLIPLDS